MLSTNRFLFPILPVAVMLFFTACSKYAEGPTSIGGSPAYLRVFNVIPYTQTPLNSSGVVPFFTFVLDPQFDKSGATDTGAIVCDWLGTRQLYCTSYPLTEGNSLGASLDTFVNHNINYEYPGSAHVLAAPTINGYDLSAWAQVPSGKHRVQFIARPENNTPFDSLSTTIRNAVTIDTTIDLQPGEVYTLEAISTDEDKNIYGAYLRQEQFTHQNFSDTNLYASFYNLSGKKSIIQQNNFPDSFTVSGTFRVLNDVEYNSTGDLGYTPVAGWNDIYLSTLTQHFAPTAPFIAMPLLPESYYFDDQNVFRTYGTYTTSIISSFGTLPSQSFYFTSPGSPATASVHEVDCIADPASINNLPLYELIVTEQGGFQEPLPNMNLFSTTTGQPQVYPSIVIFEVVYGAVYMTRIQPAFYN